MDAATNPQPPSQTTGQGPLPEYRAKLASGELAHDPAQGMAAERLQDLWAELRGYDPPPAALGWRSGLCRK